MALDGIMFEGVSVRVRRPNDYNPTAAVGLGASGPNPNLNLAAIGLGGAGGGGGGAMGGMTTAGGADQVRRGPGRSHTVWTRRRNNVDGWCCWGF